MNIVGAGAGAGVDLNRIVPELGGVGIGLDLELLDGVHGGKHGRRHVVRVHRVHPVDDVAVIVIPRATGRESGRGEAAGHGPHLRDIRARISGRGSRREQCQLEYGPAF